MDQLPDAKTPVLQDKRLWTAIGTVLSLLLAKYLKLELDPTLLATIGGVVATYLASSAHKEAKTNQANAAAIAVASQSPQTPPSQP